MGGCGLRSSGYVSIGVALGFAVRRLNLTQHDAGRGHARREVIG
jgi:hypothetical protein